MIYLIQRYKREKQLKKGQESEVAVGLKLTGGGMKSTLSQI